MNNENKDATRNWHMATLIISLITMFIGAVMMFGRTYAVDYEWAYNSLGLHDGELPVYKSVALGVFALGFILYLISREIKDNLNRR